VVNKSGRAVALTDTDCWQNEAMQFWRKELGKKRREGSDSVGFHRQDKLIIFKREKEKKMT